MFIVMMLNIVNRENACPMQLTMEIISTMKLIMVMANLWINVLMFPALKINTAF